MKQLNKCVLFFIVLFLNTTYLFADIGNRGRWDNGGTSNFGMSLWVLLGIIAGGFFACIFIKNGLENGFKDKELNKTGWYVNNCYYCWIIGFSIYVFTLNRSMYEIQILSIHINRIQYQSIC